VKVDFSVFVKGLLMGAADIVPGVSGGTVAFIMGIYERLLQAIQSIIPECLRLMKERNIVVFWKGIDGAFLLTLFVGILVSVLSLAKLITYLLVFHPIPLWAGFFGLILASVYIVAKDVDRWNLKLLFVAVIGASCSFAITQLAPAEIEQNLLNAFLSGMLAICAMILPGISGSFILVMLGTYSYILSAIKGLELSVLFIFAAGCLCGLLSIANVLVWAFSRFRDVTLAMLTGFMVGALSKVWPWKEVLQFRENSHGRQVALLERNILPSSYEVIVGLPSQLMLAVIFCVGAIIFVVGLSKFADRK